MHRSRRPLVTGLLALAAAGALAGCSSGGSTGGTPTATATTTVTAAPSAGGSPTGGSSAPSPSQGSATNGGDGASGGSGTSGGSASGRCATGDLTGSIAPGGGGAAGSVDVHLVLTNTGSTTCTLQGWPGVSFVGGGNGTQIGAAATQEQGSPHPTVTLASGQAAVAPLKIGQAGNYDVADCGQTSPDGFRVYPPGSKQSLFVKETAYTACRGSGATLLSVQALVPEGQATS
ncbi:DUF4232 domain-containing protein [Curtobacterium sp. VKM Ac-2922]|uniref:DUF4232 domain-containing protein n=1 Tax=Curtobacterium sp. VKM Ac-2922 TaxID=2929475 RepID=UPI001FB2712C|nr:DUF4232 domain-containing protein [Curtobacterium sp. VKM Ac-2922]MCJ1715013.1 DUF4232 domain-containing protein [Curtobacterium sp. VKM Ac-2922]